jgi:hypothetical protein
MRVKKLFQLFYMLFFPVGLAQIVWRVERASNHLTQLLDANIINLR